MTRIRVRHSTTYEFETPVPHALQLLRMTPRSYNGQFVRKWRVSLDADAHLDRRIDAFGNVSHLVMVQGPLEKFSILVEGEVETTNTVGIVSGSAERQPAALFLRSTRLTAPSAEIRQFAVACQARGKGEPLATLHDMSQSLRDRLKFRLGTQSPAASASDAFKAETGVSQDLAHVFIAAARSIGIPARYVAGYFLRSDTEDHEAGHAWVEAFVNGFGWIAFDATLGECPTDRHVRVAVGCDSLDAAPVRGTGTTDAADALSVAIRVEQGKRIVEG